MRAAYVVALAVVLYTYAGYPLIIALLARLRPSPWVRGPVAAAASVILPVHNGMALLPGKVDQLLRLDASLIHEVIVVLDGGDDGAAEWLAEHGDTRVRAIVLAEQQGKSAALRRGMSIATGELLLFLDIRPDVTEDAIRHLFSNFADPHVGCVAGELRVHTAEHGTTSAVGGLYWRYEQGMRNCESTYSSPVGVYGGFYAVRRSLAVPPPDGLILDDMFQPLWIIRQGYRNVVDRLAIVHDRWPATSSGEFERKVRTLAGNFQLCAEQPWLLSPRNPVFFQLVSHKLLRLVVPYCGLCMLLSAAVLGRHSAAWLAVAVSQFALLLFAGAGDRISVPPLRKVAVASSALLLLNAAAVRALWLYLFLRGPLWKIWKPTPSPSPSLHITQR